ncbi:hypothetical protein L9F63_017115, partial [Diploptera punctata]
WSAPFFKDLATTTCEHSIEEQATSSVMSPTTWSYYFRSQEILSTERVPKYGGASSCLPTSCPMKPPSVERQSPKVNATKRANGVRSGEDDVVHVLYQCT